MFLLLVFSHLVYLILLSYKTPLAQALIGKETGATVTPKIGANEEKWTILSIARWVDKK